MTDPIVLGIDGDCAFALLGPDLQEGESVFVRIVGSQDVDRATDIAYMRLCRTLKYPSHPFRYDESHPRFVK